MSYGEFGCGEAGCVDLWFAVTKIVKVCRVVVIFDSNVLIRILEGCLFGFTGRLFVVFSLR